MRITVEYLERSYDLVTLRDEAGKVVAAVHVDTFSDVLSDVDHKMLFDGGSVELCVYNPAWVPA